MSVTRIIILVVAVVAAGAAAFLARGLIGGGEKQVQAAPTPNVVMTDVLVAANTIPLGARVDASMLKWQQWPQSALDSSLIARELNPDAIKQFEGGVARVNLVAGEPVSARKIVRSDSAGFMSATLQPGMRAISIEVSPESGAGGFILPNDRVDVIMTRKIESSTEGTRGYASATVLTNVRVLAIDQTYKEEEGNQVVVGKTATLELSPQDAEALALAKAMGTLALSLVSLDEGAQSADAAGSRFGTQSNIEVIRYGVKSRAPVAPK